MGTTVYPERDRGRRDLPEDPRRGRVEYVHTAPESGATMVARDEVRAVAGRGLEGDRYFDDAGFWNRYAEDKQDTVAGDVTCIEAEALDDIRWEYGVELDPGEHRRNITTRDVALNHLVDRRFRVGEAVLEGIGLCEPCGYMQSLTGTDGVAEALTHRGGLDARVVESGVIRPGDTIEW